MNYETINKDEFDFSKIEDKELYMANDGIGKLNYLDCPLCKNKGYIAYRDDYNCISAKRCSCMNQRKILEKIETSGLKSSFQKYRFDNFIPEKDWQKTILKNSKEYLNDYQGTWLVMSGAVGSGKTHLCTSVVDQLIHNGHDIEYIPFISKMPSIQLGLSSFNNETREQAEKELERMKNVEILYIDDFMKTKSIKIDLLFDIIDHRYRNDSLITIISTELTFDDLKRHDYALASRIKERTGNYWVEISSDESRNQRIKR